MLRTSLNSDEECQVRQRLLCQSAVLHDSHGPSPVAHKIYGIPQTLNTANYACFLALHELPRLQARPGLKVGYIVNGTSRDAPMTRYIG